MIDICPTLEENFLKVLHDHTTGDPMRADVKWTNLSRREIAKRLTAMVADPCEYTWSSHRCHGAGHADPILDSFPEWEQLGRTEPERRARWRRKVRGEQPAKELDGVRSSVRSGRPYGAEDWVEVISHRLGIVREPRRRGRPPREKML